MSEVDAEPMGDSEKIPCAWCGEDIYVIDDFIDGVMKEGHELECDCGKVTVVTSVDYDVTVFGKRKT